MHVPPTIEAIDNLLPQTQCGLCTYPGCKPYAQAIIDKDESIDRCLPGGVETLVSLGELTGRDPTPYLANMQEKAIPPQLAVIREDACIGCTKCIQACPVDAIIGAGKQMHTVISDICTGCGLCLSPCPVDCIDMIDIPSPSGEEKRRKAAQARMRFQARNKRLTQNSEPKHTLQKVIPTTTNRQSVSPDAITAAVARVMAKKSAKI